MTAAQTALENARANKDTAAAGQTTAETNLTNASNAVSAAQAALTTATSQKQEADSAVAAAQKKVDDAQAALTAAQAQIAKGSFGFFESVGATAAINALNRTGFNNVQKNPSTGEDSGKRFTDYVKKGDAKDATALDSMKNSIEWIKYANAIREEAGLSVFKVTDELMASAQANADFSSVIYNHASNYGSDLRNNAENLFKANITIEYAYQGWYYSEKQAFDNAVAQDPSLEQYRYDAYGLYMANPQVYYNVGHYLNFVWPNSTLTGIGLCYNNGTASIQHFAGSSYGEPTFTVEEYETRFMNYYNSVKGAPEQALADAQAELEAAQAVQTEKATALKDAEATLTTAQGEETSAREALTQAQQAVTNAASQETTAQGNLTAANAAISAAEQEVAAAEQDAQQKQGAVDTAQAALDQLQPSLEAAQQALDAAKADYEAEVAAQADIDAKTKAAQDALDKATRAAQAAGTAAVEAVQAQVAADESMQAVDAILDKTSDEALAAAKAAKNDTATAKAKADEAKRLADDAKSAADAAVASANALSKAVQDGFDYATPEQKEAAQAIVASAGQQLEAARQLVKEAVEAQQSATAVAEQAALMADEIGEAVEGAKALANVVAKIEAAAKSGKEADVVAARAAYNKLTPDLKALVPSGVLAKLTKAEKAIKEAKAASTIKKGKTYEVSNQSYKVTTVASGSKAGAVVFAKAKNAKSVSVPATVKLADGKTYKVTQVGATAFTASKIRTVTVGENVTKLAANAFNKSKATTLKLKTTKLTKASVKGCLKGSKVKTVQAPASKRTAYKKIFTKAVAGKKVTVK